MSDHNDIIDALPIEELSALLREAGYRTNETEHNGSKQLLSASQGIGFAVRPGNMLGEGLLDFTISCALRIQGELPEGLIPAWNRGKRFSRLSRHGDFLVLEMDVIVAGGVRRAHVRANLEIWDRLLQDFLLYLRNYRNESRDEGAVDRERMERTESKDALVSDE